jgi:hypothetical protein
MLTIAIIIALGLTVGLMVLQAMLMFSIGTTLDDVIEAIKDVRREISQLREDLIIKSMGSK